MANPSRVSRPWTTATASAEAATPQPRLAAKATAANPSRVAFSASLSMPRPSPSSREPRIVSGPTQNTSEAVTKPSTNRARPAASWPSRSGQPPADPGAHPFQAVLDRSSDPTIPPTRTEPSTIRMGALVPTASSSSGSTTAAALVAATSRVTRPSPSVTTSRVRCGSRSPSSAPRPAPTSTVTTLSAVPAPRNTRWLPSSSAAASSRENRSIRRRLRRGCSGQPLGPPAGSSTDPRHAS